MNDEQLEAAERLFHEALERPAGDREAYLAEAAPDGEVEARVVAMIAGLDGDSIDRPPYFDFDEPLAEGPGTTIGRYKLLQCIGQGGFGVVYMAEQREPVLRKVALKIIKLGMDTKEVVARFEAERQALALMDHPNIARVFDAGTTSSGRPYFVMELVRGVSITEYCDQNQVSTTQRLEIFENICHAVQHAHSKGVIHRDIKPSNVLVTHHDTGPMPKIIDFGIAKAIHTPLTEKTLFTNYRHFIGTPQYMSPEQATMSALDVDTRTDIYSLGVLLYELLTGTTPFDAATLMEKGLDEMKRVVREEEPVRPSMRLTTTNDPAFARRQGGDADSLIRRVRGDLDWIVLRALAKDRSRRYATAHEFAADVRRHLEGQPVVAGPPTAAYRLSKLYARNRVVVISGALVAISLITGIIGTSMAMIEAGRQRDEAVLATRHARIKEREADDAKRDEARLRVLAQDQLAGYRRLTRFLDETLAQADPETSRDPERSLPQLLERASSRIGTAFAGEPEGEMQIRRTIGRAFNSLGHLELAARHLRRACDLGEAHPDTDRIEHYKTLWTLTGISFRLDRPDSFGIAAWAFRVGYDHIEKEHPALAASLRALSSAFESAAHNSRGADTAPLRAALETTSALADRTLERGDPRWPIVADTYMAAGYTIWHTSIEAESERCFELALEIQERELSPAHPIVAETVSLIAGVLSRSGRAPEAEARIRKTVELCRSIYPNGAWQTAFAVSMLGECLAAQRRFEEAEPLLLEADADLRRVWGSEMFYALDSAKRLVQLYDAWDRPERARPHREFLARGIAHSLYVSPWAIMQHAFGPEDAALRQALARIDALCGDAWGLHDDGADPARVVPLIDALYADHEAEFLDGSARAAVIGRCLVHWTKKLDADAATALRARMASKAVEIFAACGEDLALESAQAEAILSDAAHHAGDADGAARHAARSLRFLGIDQAPTSWVDSLARIHVANVLFPQKSYRELEALLRPGYELLADLFGEDNADAAAARRKLVELYESWGRADEASRYR